MEYFNLCLLHFIGFVLYNYHYSMDMNNIKKECSVFLMCLYFASFVVYQTLQCWWMALWWRLKNEAVSKLAICSGLVVVGHLNTNDRSFDPGRTACTFVSCPLWVRVLQWGTSLSNMLRYLSAETLILHLEKSNWRVYILSSSLWQKSS